MEKKGNLLSGGQGGRIPPSFYGDSGRIWHIIEVHEGYGYFLQQLIGSFFHGKL